MAHIEIIIPNSGGMNVNIPHNLLDGLQGLGEDYYHLNESQYNKLLDVIYENLTVDFFNTPLTGERGLSTGITLHFEIDSNDDTIISAAINQGVGSIIDSIDQGEQTVSGGSRVTTTVYTLTINYERNDTPGTTSIDTTYTAYVPQWSGTSVTSDLNELNYAVLNEELNKVVQSTDTISINVAPSNEYVWFVSTNPNATITNNGFNTIIGEWDSATAFFIKQTITFTLADGVTTSSLTFYRTRELKNHSTQNYTIT